MNSYKSIGQRVDILPRKSLREVLEKYHKLSAYAQFVVIDYSLLVNG